MTNASEKAWAAWGGRSDSRGAFRSLPARSPQTARLAVLMENLLVQLLLSGVSLCPCRTDRGPQTPPQSVVEREGPFRSIYPFKPVLCGVYLSCVRRPGPLQMPADLHLLRLFFESSMHGDARTRNRSHCSILRSGCRLGMLIS